MEEVMQKENKHENAQLWELSCAREEQRQQTLTLPKPNFAFWKSIFICTVTL